MLHYTTKMNTALLFSAHSNINHHIHNLTVLYNRITDHVFNEREEQGCDLLNRNQSRNSAHVNHCLPQLFLAFP